MDAFALAGIGDHQGSARHGPGDCADAHPACDFHFLVGGAMVDRHSPKTVLMLNKYANKALMSLLAGLVFTDQASLPALCSVALLFGLASAFSVPAGCWPDCF